MIDISPSVLGADLMNLGKAVDDAKTWGVRWLHLDQMDGHFAPNISFGPGFVKAIHDRVDLFLDVHLMLSNPSKYIEAYAKAGSDLITVHVEADDNAADVLRQIRSYGIQAGISINPGTPAEAVRELLPLCDVVLVMTVEPGFGGQTLREDCVEKLPVLRQMIEESGRKILLEVDGGVKQDNAKKVLDAGADVLVMGTGLFRAENPKAIVEEICGVRQA